jgi:hypothetical protein
MAGRAGRANFRRAEVSFEGERVVIWFLSSLAIVLVVGDFGSTFLYHVPQHLWFKLHLRTHHDRTRSYWDHAIVSQDPWILLDGLLGALPYILIAAGLSLLGPAWMAGAVAGLVLGQAHVWWRHTCEIGWVSPSWLVRLSRTFALVLPEDHNGHHQNPDVEFGDLFRFYDAPARAMLTYVRTWQRRRRTALKRLHRIHALRTLRNAQQA